MFGKTLLTAFFALATLLVQAQYIARLEPHPFTNLLSVCAGAQITVKGNHIENLNSPSTISMRISDANGNMANGTDLNIDEHSFDGTSWTAGNLTWTGNISGPVYYRVTLPATLPPSSNYNLKLQSSNPQYIQSDQDFNATLEVTAPYATIADVAPTDFGQGEWFGHGYTWTATTSDPFFTQALVDAQDFFNTDNYLGHFVETELSFDNDYTSNGGKMPGALHDGTSIPCYDQQSQDYSIRFQRTETFAPGRYRFEIQGDDGIRFSIDGGNSWIVDSFLEQTYNQSYQTSDATHPQGVCMSGDYDLVIEFFQRPADHRVTFTCTQLTPDINVPESDTLCIGESTSFDAAATGGGLSWQWQESTDGGSNWTDISNGGVFSGATSGVLTVTGATAGMDGNLYQALVTGLCDNPIATDPVALVVEPGALITSQDDVVEVCAGDNALIGIVAEGGTGFQWQADFGNGFENLPDSGMYSNVNSQTMLVIGADATLNNVQFRCVIAAACGPPTISDPITLLVQNNSVLSGQAQDANICEGDTVQFTVQSDSENPEFQWERSVDDGLTWETLTDEPPFSGTATGQLSVVPDETMNGTLFHCVLSGCGTDAISDPVELTVTAGVEEPLIPNVFTPNNDQLNDILMLPVDDPLDYHVWIYDRWGLLVGEWNRPGAGWDGREFNGTEVPPGQYYMLVDITTACLTINKGTTVTLLR